MKKKTYSTAKLHKGVKQYFLTVLKVRIAHLNLEVSLQKVGKKKK